LTDANGMPLTQTDARCPSI